MSPSTVPNMQKLSVFTQMSDLATNLAGYQQQIAMVLAGTTVAVAAAVGTVVPGATTVEGIAAVLGDAGALDESKQPDAAAAAAAANQTVPQAVLPGSTSAGSGG